MITLNRFAQRCLNIMRKRFKMNEHSSRKAFSIRIEAVWRKFDIASKYRSDNLPKYSEDEELAAEMIIYLVAYLKRFGCEDIEQLIKDKIEFDDRKNDQVLLLTVCVVDFNIVSYDRDYSSLPT